MPTSEWCSLFTLAGDARTLDTIDVRVLTRKGSDFLVLPQSASVATVGLDLYPAQSLPARLAKSALKLSLGLGIAPGGRRQELTLDGDAPLVIYMKKLAGASIPPEFALLAGNPQVAGRRYIILVDLGPDKPNIVLKVGVNARARELIDHEASFLESAPPMLAGLPRLVGRLDHDQIKVIALPYVEGRPIKYTEQSELATLLEGWLNQDKIHPVAHLGAWRRLTEASGVDQDLAHLANKLVCPAVFHGDLAPWNIKENQEGGWIALDWERGEIEGPPGWDWFHFVTQPLLLVQRKSPPHIAREVEKFLDSSAFDAYARNAGFHSFSRDWYLAYLNYARLVLRQTEGSMLLQALTTHLRNAWRQR